MEIEGSPWAKARLLPVPGRDACEIDLSDTLTLGEMPFEELLEFGVAQRVPERYNEKGNHPSDKHGDNLVDTCVATGGVQLATKFLLEVCGQRSTANLLRSDRYELRQDAAPWGQLRRHLAAASPQARDQAKALATTARTMSDHRKQAVAFAFCDPDWVREDLESALHEGYGLLCLLAALETPAQARDALATLLGKQAGSAKPPLYQLIEEGVWFMPNLLRTLDAADAPLVLEAARRTWNKAVRKPWLEIVACLPGADAQAFLDEHGYVKTAANKTAAKKTTAKKPAAKKPAAKKPAAKKPAKQPVAKQKPAAKKPAKRR